MLNLRKGYDVSMFMFEYERIEYKGYVGLHILFKIDGHARIQSKDI